MTEKKQSHSGATKSVVACVRLTPQEAQTLSNKYGSVGKALKVLTASITREK